MENVFEIKNLKFKNILKEITFSLRGISDYDADTMAIECSSSLE